MNTRKLKKLGSAVIAIICALLIFITGTYAFQIMTQQGWGRAVSRDQLPTGRLHVDQEVVGDNFGELNWYPGQSANNEVYVENFGDITPIFTRVRLFEYMESGIGAQLHPKDADFAGRDVQPLIEGADRLDPTTWEVVLPHSEETGEPSAFRNYWALTQDGGSKHFMPTFNQDPVSREPDVKGDAWGLVPMSPEQPNSTRRGLPHAVEDERDYLTDQAYAYPPEAGLSDYFEQNPTYEATVKTYDWDLDIHIMDTAPVPHTARETLDAKIMTMEQWHDAGKPVGEIWVLDTDGWAYWAEALEPGEATGLLLNEMTYISPAIGTIYYAIYADAQMATLSSWELAFDDLTDDAEDLMNTIANPAYEITLSESGTVSFPDEYVSNTESADRVITVTNAGNYPTGELSIELGGANPDSFELSTTTLPNLDVGESTTFTIHSRAGLAIGTYTATVTVYGDENIIAQSFDVSISIKVVPTHGISLSTSGTHTFPEVTLPRSTQSGEHSVTVRNVGNQPTGDLTVALSGTNANRFTISATNLTSIASGETETFTVRSNESLAIGTYTATVTVSGGSNITAQSFNVSIAVKDGISLMRTGLVNGTVPTSPFLTFPTLQRQQVARVDVIDRYIPDLNAFAKGTYNDKKIVAAVDLTHKDSDYPVVAFYIDSNTSGRFDVFIAGHRGVVATGSLQHFFGSLHNVKSINVKLLDTSRVTSLSHTFRECTSLTALDLSGWDTSRVTNMRAMLQSASSLKSLNMSGFDTSRVTDMVGTFSGVSSLTNLDLSKWNTSSVKDMQLMFQTTSSLTTLNLSGWDTSNVTNMSHMFLNATALTSLDLSKWNTSRVTGLNATFYDMTSLKSLNLSGWDTSNVTNMSSMFVNTTSLTNVDFRKATFGKVTDNTYMFTNSGINKITVGSAAAQNYIQNAPGWARTPARTIERG